MLTDVVGCAVVIVLAVVALRVLPRSQPATGHLDRRAVRGDERAHRSGLAVTAFRRRAPLTRGAVGASPPTSTTTDVAVPPPQAPSPRREAVTPVDLEELGVTRRQFFNRSILAGIGLAIGSFGAASLGFLWPIPTAGGFGGKIAVGAVSDAQAAFATKQPYYNAAAQTYMVPYPAGDLGKAAKAPAYAPILAGMTLGYVALYQRCVHLGCRVPWCQSSQWFECPCHGSKYNRVGEKQGGPAPRGLDRFTFDIEGGTIVVDTGNLVIGPPIGTDTTDQAPEGALCV